MARNRDENPFVTPIRFHLQSGETPLLAIRPSALVGLLLLASGLILTGCSSLLEGGAAVAATPTAGPADVSGDGLEVAPSPACLAADFSSIQTNQSQGDLLAWSTAEPLLAFIAPPGRSWGWYEGDLVILDPVSGEEKATRDVSAYGDLTWSPDGRKIAFIALRAADTRLTILIYDLETSTLVDLYVQGGASDEFAGQKGILRWSGNQSLQVAERCGVDCVRFVEHNLGGGAARILDERRANQDNSLEIALYQPGISPNPNWSNANWSPQADWVFFTDRNQVGWLADLTQETKAPLELGIGRVAETKWSADSQWIAIRTSERIYLYSLDCSN